MSWSLRLWAFYVFFMAGWLLADVVVHGSLYWQVQHYGG